MKKETLSYKAALDWYAHHDIDCMVDDFVHPPLENALNHNLVSDKSTQQEILSSGDASFYEDENIKEARRLADKAQTIDELRNYLKSFEGCSLKKTATNTVFGDGVNTAKIMFIGEAPGVNEDKQGRPFCGESGKLLDSMLEAIDLCRTRNVYITNTIFWRPPANRVPTDLEIETCRPFVEKHIALVDPKLLILVGSTAATSLIGKHVQITKIRKEFYSYTNKYLNYAIPVTAIFHPAYLLRQPMQKKTSWYDLLHIKQFLDESAITY